MAPILAKAKPEVQEQFLAEELNPVLEEAKHGKRHVFFVDASHFVFAAFLGSLWCFTRIFLPTESGRQRYHVLGAFNAISHEVVTITNTAYINSQSVVDLLTKLRAQFSELPMTLVLDNAVYQRCALVRDTAAEFTIQLLFLPPYSPNLTLIERLEKFVKAQCLHSVYHETFAAFKQAMDDCLTKTATDYKPQLDTLLTLNFQHFKAS
ncbi:MAG: IS630 family transposase [Firmicutes bacterium]|nr:IS630 family transposase [Bacillota bacterium]